MLILERLLQISQPKGDILQMHQMVFYWLIIIIINYQLGDRRHVVNQI